MRIGENEIDRRMRSFEDMCRKLGVKRTHQRMEIFREVAQTAEHPDAEKVYRSVSERIPTMSLDTVYRTLWLLKDLGLITTLGSPRERTRFDANLDHHHHFVCVKCGLTRDFYSDYLNSLKLPDSLLSIGQAVKTQVEVKGLCRECAAGENLGEKKKEATL
jgi:Fur family peroxide stress response transcriptional regulator